ncbi:MAG: DUF2279 domain-containing protein, partial [Ignavibacteria bacterium]|nr:DUF2279 domain-containing protein [Ignavibacteria bacterium]
MRKIFIVFLLIQTAIGKTSQVSQPDSTKINDGIKWEILAPVTVAVGAFNYALYKYYQRAWWNEKTVKFHTFNDWNNADMNIDKIGHIYGGIALTKSAYKLLRLSNVPEGYSMFISSFASLFFQMQIEFHDAYFEKWGWSWWDVGSNVIGAVYPNLQKLWHPLN